MWVLTAKVDLIVVFVVVGFYAADHCIRSATLFNLLVSDRFAIVLFSLLSVFFIFFGPFSTRNKWMTTKNTRTYLEPLKLCIGQLNVFYHIKKGFQLLFQTRNDISYLSIHSSLLLAANLMITIIFRDFFLQILLGFPLSQTIFFGQSNRKEWSTFRKISWS